MLKCLCRNRLTVHSRLYPLFIHQRKEWHLRATRHIWLGCQETFFITGNPLIEPHVNKMLLLGIWLPSIIDIFSFIITFCIVSMKGFFIHQLFVFILNYYCIFFFFILTEYPGWEPTWGMIIQDDFPTVADTVLILSPMVWF